MIFTATLPARAAGAADIAVLAGAYAPAFYSGDTVTDIELVAPHGFSPMTGGASDYVGLTVRQLRDGVPVQVFAGLALDQAVTLTPVVPVSIPLVSQPTLRKGDVLDVLMHQHGSGQAIQAGLTVSIFVS
ncbi:hypothetical protein [Nocardia shimofusensis]|uniref:hypothetical protein n=1 Tax=Nocardia shimofusensis TaxID=228596 RepID=UPI0008349CFE|nr:hypothetical protein [Nocardia shimofusensis]